MRAWLTCLLMLAAIPAWANGWTVEVTWDSMTDRRSATVTTRVDEEHRFLLWFPAEGGVRASLNVPAYPGLHEQLMPIYRIDRAPAVDLTPQAQARAVKIKGDAMGWRLAEDRSATSGELAQLLAGGKLRVRYFDRAGKDVDLTIDLDGLARAYQLAAELQQ